MFESYRTFKRSSVASWEYIKLGEGKSWKGWLAGPMVGVPSHFEGGTVGCRKALSKGDLKCGCDVKEMETRWRGYAPLWDKDGLRWVIIIGERFGELGMRLKTGQQVRVTKTTGRGCPIKLEEHVWTTELPQLSQADKLPQDLRPWMGRIWDDEELEQWFYDHRHQAPDLLNPIPFTKADTTTPVVVAKLKDRFVLKANEKDGKLPPTLGEAMNGIHKGRKRD